MKPTERFTLVADDDLTVMDGTGRRGGFRSLMPDDIWALQWHGPEQGGEIEYRDLTVEKIDQLPGWAVATYNATKTREQEEIDAAAAEAGAT